MEPIAHRRTARFGTFEADFDSRQLTKSGFRIRLQDQPFQLLALMLERQGQVVTREELKEKLWPGDTFVEFDVGLNTAIKKLRAALNDVADNPRFVETVPRIGYRFVAPVAVSKLPLASAVKQGVPARAGVESPESLISPLASPATTPKAEFPPSNVARAPRRRLGLLAAVALAVVLLTAGFAIRMRFKSAASAVPPGSIQAIAVLPLLNVSADSAQEYFADGMTDEIITDLAKLAGPKVISRTTAMQYKGTRKTIPEIARELHVGAVLEGSVERSSDRMRVRVQLIEASTDQHLWAEAYDRQVSDVLLLEAELARDIARQIELRLTPQQQQNFAHNRTLNPQAFQDYLQGRHYWAMRTNESLKTAVEYFNRAIQEDPNDARSYAGLAQCYIVLRLTRKRETQPPKPWRWMIHWRRHIFQLLKSGSIRTGILQGQRRNSKRPLNLILTIPPVTSGMGSFSPLWRDPRRRSASCRRRWRWTPSRPSFICNTATRCNRHGSTSGLSTNIARR
jgi:TolB-like protein/DNA-binding winged helix-turn-helix (wHTH) protein